MAFRIIDQKTYDLLIAAYRERPGVFGHAAIRAGVSHRFARTAWLKGWPQRYAWAIPIKEAFEAEQRAARQATLDAAREQERLTIDERRKAQQEAIDTLAAEGNMLNIARKSNTAAGVVIGKVWKSIDALLTHHVAKLQANPDSVSTHKAFQMAKLCASVAKDVSTAAKLLIEAERMKRGEPAQVIGLQVENITTDDAVAELEHMGDLIALARANGLIPAGTSVVHVPPPSSDDPDSSGNGQAH